MIYRHEKHGKLMQEPGGGFDPEKAKAQFAANVKKKQGGTPRREELAAATAPTGLSAGVKRGPKRARMATDPNQPSLAKAQLEHEQLRVQRTKLQNGILEGKYVDAAEAEKAWTDYITAVRNRLLERPDRLGSRFGDECRELLEAEVEAARSSSRSSCSRIASKIALCAC
jgi:hypothetical protein